MPTTHPSRSAGVQRSKKTLIGADQSAKRDRSAVSVALHWNDAAPANVCFPGACVRKRLSSSSDRPPQENKDACADEAGNQVADPAT
jgi:hypothetical protein